MDKTIRRNENCVIGLPRCDFVFSSTRTCFIAYGFEDSPLEKDILCNLLEESGIQAVEADANLAPAQNAFCAKICSKIITSQFCAILLNNDNINNIEIPNANVNMEYGLMLGFNKYVIPFQRNDQKLPFNVAGLDTIKYTDKNFKSLAKRAIDQAITETDQNSPSSVDPNQYLETFLITKRLILSSISDQGERDLLQMGNIAGFNLANDFSGLKYSYLGVFSSLRPETILTRIKLLEDIISERRVSITSRLTLGVVTQQQVALADHLFENMSFIIISNSDDDKDKLSPALSECAYHIEVYSMDDVINAFNEFNS